MSMSGNDNICGLSHRGVKCGRRFIYM